MKLFKVLFLFLISLILFSSCGRERIDAGHTGILFNHYGITDKKGVSDYEIVSGIVWYNPFTREVFEYPHYWQNARFEEISFNSIEGEPIKTSLDFQYRFERDYIPSIFDEYRLSPEELMNNQLRAMVLEELNAQAGKLGAVSIMGKLRSELLVSVKDSLNSKYSPQFAFKLVSFSSDLDPSQNVEQAIQGVINAQEGAKKAQANTVKVREETLQKQIQARGDSMALVINAKAKAAAYKLQKEQLTPELLQKQAIEKWDGKMPQIIGGDKVPFIKN